MASSRPRPLFLHDRGLLVVSIALLLLGGLYFVFGISFVLTGKANDFNYRYAEHHYLMRGITVQQIYDEAKSLGIKKYDPIPPEATLLDSSIGWPGGLYPASTYGMAMPVLGLPRSAAEVAFATMCAAGVGLGCYWAWFVSRGCSQTTRVLAVASVLGCATLGNAIRYGNFGTIVLGFLALAYLLIRRREEGGGYASAIGGGIALGYAVLKPTSGVPFLMAPLLRGRWITVLVAGGVVVAGALVTTLLSGIDPLTVTAGAAEDASGFMHKGIGLLQGLLAAGVDPQVALWTCLLGVAGVASIMLWQIRDRSLLLSFAVAAVGARYWTYHQNTDNSLLLFVLIPLLIVASKGGRACGVWFWLVGLSLWLPTRLPGVPEGLADAYRIGLSILEPVAWIGGLVVLLLAVRKDPAQLDDPQALPLNSTR